MNIKKTMSVVFSCLILALTFAFTSLAGTETKICGFEFEVPDGFERDAEAEKKLGVKGYWYNDEEEMEMIFSVNVSSYYLHIFDDKPNDFGMFVSSEDYYNSTSQHEHHPFVPDSGLEVDARVRMLFSDDKSVTSPDYVAYEYFFPVEEAGYCLSFIAKSEDACKITDEIAGSAVYASFQAKYYNHYKDIIIGWMIRLAILVVVILILICVIKLLKLVFKKRKDVIEK